MIVKKPIRDLILQIYQEKKILLEGNILKILEAESGDEDFSGYLKHAIEKDKEGRRKRLEITKQIQSQNTDLLQSQRENERINKQLSKALDEAEKSRLEAVKAKDESEKAKHEAIRAKDEALNDLDILQKRSQTELISTIVKVALGVIMSVGVVTTVMYGLALWAGKDTQIIGSTWSNMFGILLTNAFSIVGTIMGVKYASEKNNHH